MTMMAVAGGLLMMIVALAGSARLLMPMRVPVNAVVEVVGSRMSDTD